MPRKHDTPGTQNHLTPGAPLFFQATAVKNSPDGAHG